MGILEDKIQVSVLIRNCEITDSDLLFTSDDTEEIIKALRHLQSDGEKIEVDDPRYQGEDETPELPEPAWKPKRGLH